MLYKKGKATSVECHLPAIKQVFLCITIFFTFYCNIHRYGKKVVHLKIFLAFFLIDCNWHCCLCFTLVTCLMPVFHVPQSLNICSIFDIGDVLVVLVLIIPFTWTVFLIAYEKEIFQDS